MTKYELCQYAFARGFNYEDLLLVAAMMTNTEVPSREDYSAYSIQAFEEMLRTMDSIYDERTSDEKARDEMGTNYVRERNCER